MAGRKRGPEPKGDREQVSIRLPREHLEIYRADAAAAGLPLTDYVAVQLARARNLDEPAYVHRKKDEGQPALAIPA